MKKVLSILMLLAVVVTAFAPVADAANRRYVRRSSTHYDAMHGVPTPQHPKAAYYPNASDNYLPRMR